MLSNAIQLDTHKVKSGAVKLDVTNAADNNMTHELVVLKTDMADGALPVRKGTVPESRFGKIGEVENVGPGMRKPLTLKLAPGHYAPCLQQARSLWTCIRRLSWRDDRAGPARVR